MSDHTHSQYVEGCYRCDLSRDEVTSGYITEAMIEKAGRALYAYEELEMPYGSLTAGGIGHLAGQARAALEAVVPAIVQAAKAEALRDAARDWESAYRESTFPEPDTSDEWETAHPNHNARVFAYAMRHWAGVLRERADEIERGES